MTKEREELERKVDLLVENVSLREKEKDYLKREKGYAAKLKKQENDLKSLQGEIEHLQEKDEQLKGASLWEKIKDGYKDVKRSYRDDRFVWKATLAGAYAAELYFLGPIIHKHMHSLAQFMYHGYDHYLKSSQDDPASAFVFHVIGDGVGGIVVGAATGFVVGGIVDFTKSFLKPEEFDILRGLGVGALAACGGAVGGLLGAEFSGPTGIMIMSYIGTGISLAALYKEMYE